MEEKAAGEQIDDIITLYGGWKGVLLSQVRAAIKAADPKVVEQIKWRMKSRPEGLPVWYHDGIMCRTEAFKDNLKLVFSKGAQMQDPQKLFNARLLSSGDRAIEFREGDTVDQAGVQALVREAVALNAKGTHS